ncbi:MAG: PE family protein [Mycobacterium sp.]|uniref:PE family protein n=1 Tax=Mycobacterium sp. TaxID=1785 RepID=UPI003F96D205
MSYVIADPEMMTAAAADLATIGANVSAAHMVAAAPTVAVVPAAADEVSAGIAHLFSAHAQGYQALAGQAAAFNDQFVQTLKSGGAAYAQTEASSAASLLGSLLSLLPPSIQGDLGVLVVLILFSPLWLPFFFGVLVELIGAILKDPTLLPVLLAELGL